MKKKKFTAMQIAERETKRELKAIALLRSRGYFVQNLWCIEDINMAQEENDENHVTLKESIAIFDYIGENYNPETGLNWDSLRDFINDYKATIKK